MKHLFALFLISVYFASGDAMCSDWQSRMLKYGALANCERYEAKGTKFRQYFPLDDPHSQASGPLLYSFTFASIADQTVRVELSEGDDRPIPRPGNNLPEGFIEEEEEWETSTYSAFPEERDPPPRYEDRFYVKYEIVIGSVNEDSVWKNNRYNLKESYESFVQINGKRLKTLSLYSNVLRSNEPNDIRVEMYKNGRLVVIINDAVTLETRLSKMKLMKYYSFATAKREQTQEYFHKCK